MTVAEGWALLGIEATDDRREVKRAYARLLKEIDVDADPAAFIRLRDARDLALAWGTQTPEWERWEEELADGHSATLRIGDDELAQPLEDWREPAAGFRPAGGLATRHAVLRRPGDRPAVPPARRASLRPKPARAGSRERRGNLAD